jgi:hypothetical protein
MKVFCKMTEFFVVSFHDFYVSDKCKSQIVSISKMSSCLIWPMKILLILIKYNDSCSKLCIEEECSESLIVISEERCYLSVFMVNFDKLIQLFLRIYVLKWINNPINPMQKLNFKLSQPSMIPMKKLSFIHKNYIWFIIWINFQPYMLSNTFCLFTWWVHP